MEGCLPPEDSSDRAENLTRSVSDEIAKNIFLARTKKSGCHFSDFPHILEGRLPPEDGFDQAENLTRSVSDEIAKNIFLARSKNPGVTFRIFPIFRIPRAHGSGALGSQPVRSTAILVDNKKNQIASRFDLFCWYVF